MQLENNPTKTPQQQAELEAKKKKLAELLKKQQGANTNATKYSDKTGLYVGVGLLTLLFIFILARNHKRKLRN